MNELLLEVIKNKPIIDSSHINWCPYCGSSYIEILSREYTLLGVEEWNHHWDKSHCKNCNSTYYHEYKGDYNWYTDNDGICIKGVSNCYELDKYECNICNGTIRRQYTELDGTTPTNCLPVSYRPYKKHYREFWICDTCDVEIELE